MNLNEEEREAVRLARQVFAGPNVSVAGGELAFNKYLAALRVVDVIIQKMTEDELPFEDKKGHDEFNSSTGDTATI